jgi:mannose-6-phosphate isomerase-like protein (cupin superfamily)
MMVIFDIRMKKLRYSRFRQLLMGSAIPRRREEHKIMSNSSPEPESDAAQVRLHGGLFNVHRGHLHVQPSGLETHLVLTPNVGTRGIGLTAGTHYPGQGMLPHKHPISEEILIAFRGKGQFYIHDRWYDVEEGDIAYAPAGVWHGTRNPEGNTEPFVTIGCASPPQLDLYDRAGYILESGPAVKEAE